MIVCAGEFDAPDLGNPDYSRLNLNLWSTKGGTALTLRRNIKVGVYELVDETGKVVGSSAGFATVLASGKASALGAKGLTIADMLCDHSIARKAFCPTYNEAQRVAALPPVVEGAL